MQCRQHLIARFAALVFGHYSHGLKHRCLFDLVKKLDQIGLGDLT
jgi:hypothetical protein